jgi:hypothetical protein
VLALSKRDLEAPTREVGVVPDAEGRPLYHLVVVAAGS